MKDNWTGQTELDLLAAMSGQPQVPSQQPVVPTHPAAHQPPAQPHPVSGPQFFDDIFQDIPSAHQAQVQAQPGYAPHAQPQAPHQAPPAQAQAPQANYQQVSPAHGYPVAQPAVPAQPQPQHQTPPQQVAPAAANQMPPGFGEALQIMVPRAVPGGSPFSFDDDEVVAEAPAARSADHGNESIADIEGRIEQLALDAERALQQLEEARQQSASILPAAEPPIEEDPGDEDLFPDEVAADAEADEPPESTKSEPSEEVVLDATEIDLNPEIESEPTAEDLPPPRPEPQDRIPLDSEINAHLSLQGRMNELWQILRTHVHMEAMAVIDRRGLALFETLHCDKLSASTSEYIAAVEKIFTSGVDEHEAREHSASQVALPSGGWLCLISLGRSDDPEQFLLKGIIPEPLDRPEIYVVMELFFEVLRPDVA